MWTVSTEEEEYLHMLQSLFDRITVKVCVCVCVCCLTMVWHVALLYRAVRTTTPQWAGCI